MKNIKKYLKWVVKCVEINQTGMSTFSGLSGLENLSSNASSRNSGLLNWGPLMFWTLICHPEAAKKKASLTQCNLWSHHVFFMCILMHILFQYTCENCVYYASHCFNTVNYGAYFLFWWRLPCQCKKCVWYPEVRFVPLNGNPKLWQNPWL